MKKKNNRNFTLKKMFDFLSNKSVKLIGQDDINCQMTGPLGLAIVEICAVAWQWFNR